MAHLLRVLVIEDDEDDFIIIRGILSTVPNTRYQVTWVRSYQEGLNALCRSEHDVCLLDYELGEKNGLDFLKDAAAGKYQAPIIVLTGMDSYERDLQVMHAGAADFLVKDQISPPLLERSIRYAISQRIADLELRASVQRYQDAETRYRTLFTECPISLSEDDFSEIKSHLNMLKASGVNDFRAYFNSHADEVKRCAQSVNFVDVNRATLDLYGANSAAEFRNGLSLLFIEESYEGFKEALIALAEGKTKFEIDTVNQNLKGEKIDISARISVPSGYEESLSRVFVSIMDITKRKKAEEDLRRSQKQLKQLSSQLLKVQEKERKQLANEIHDSIGQTLHVIRAALERFKQDLDSGEGVTDSSSIEEVLGTVDFAIEEVRNIYMGIRPSLLDDLGLLATMNWFVREFRKANPDIQVEAAISLEEHQIPDPLKTILFRTLQSAMENVSKHSKATRVSISLHNTTGALALRITDNGHGFKLENADSGRSLEPGLGLASMQERVESSGGVFIVRAVKNRGTAISSSWQLDSLNL